MKSALAAMVLISSLATAEPLAIGGLVQRDSSGPNLIVFNPGDLFTGAVTVRYERALLPWFGVTGGATVWAFRSMFAPTDEPSFTGLTPELGFRFHYLGTAPAGWWLGANVLLGPIFTRTDTTAGRGWAWGIGASAGYTAVLERHLTFQFGLGANFLDLGDRLSWSPRLTVALGYAF